MDGEQSDGGGSGGQPEVEDEFACAGMLRGSLNSLHDPVERIFRVVLRIGAEDLPHGNDGQIWLKLQGSDANVKAAKLFIKGIVNPEEQQEVSYPRVLNCVFCGAKGLFMDCLIKSTSAHVMVGSPGFLLISGLAEPVVRAYSLITDLLERYEGTQSRRSEIDDKGSGESLESRRAFKTLVEKWEDRHILDLLVLPGSVKEVLLDLVKESGLGSNPRSALTDGLAGAGLHGEDRWNKPAIPMHTLPEHTSVTDPWTVETAPGSGTAAKNSFLPGTSARAEDAVERGRETQESPQEVEEEEPPGNVETSEESEEFEDEEVRQPSAGNKEFWLLLKFFTAMGYTEDVVNRVLSRTGPKEASQILDLVQQEQDCSDTEQADFDLGNTDQSNHSLNPSERSRPCETEHRGDGETAGLMVLGSNVEMGEGDGATESLGSFQREGSAEETEEGHEDDFVLGVLKKAAVSCGYKEQNVAKVYSMLPDRSTHHLLLELQREGSRHMETSREGPREMDDMVLEKEGQKAAPALVQTRREAGVPVGPFVTEEKTGASGAQVENLVAPELDWFTWSNQLPPAPARQYSSQTKEHQHSTPDEANIPEVKGPPMNTYPTSINSPLSKFQSNKQYFHINQPTVKINHPTQNHIPNVKPQSSNSLKQALQAPQPPVCANLPPTRAKERRGFMPTSSVVVTGEQRFLEGLQTPFDLQLTDKPGNPKLRTIIIDGSNVAMSHGLGHFFSCRGIALAVQHFWDRGHRHISALLPQWRQKSDPRTKEHHYLTELQQLGLLSYTPSREVQGKRISSYDDRLMLQLAQRTDGVIVTNDNLRDLLDESPVWRDIIKKRLLQYTFVGDHFMVPDDPLGRGGPHLDDFLCSEHRTPDPGNHSFAGVATTFPSSKAPRSQTEVLNFRDRTLGGALKASGGASRGKGRGRGRGSDMGLQHWKLVDRTTEETACLREQLCQVFPGQDSMVTLVLQCHPAEMDINVLSECLLEVQND